MVKYIYLVLAIIFLGMFIYFFLGNRLNRRLNIKKKQIAVSPEKNKYTKLMFVSSCFFFIFGMLFVIKVISRDYDELKTFNNSFEYQEKLIDDDLRYQSISNSVEYKEINRTLEDEENVYFYNKNQIIKIDKIINKTNKTTISEEFLIKSLYQNNSYVVVLSEREETSRIDIISKYDLSNKNTLIIDGIINAVVVNNEELNIIVSNKAEKNSFKNGYRQNKNEKVYFEDVMYIDCCSFDKILTHVKLDFESFKIWDKSICVADEYIIFNEDLYIVFNSFSGVESNNKFYILKYSIEDMDVVNYRSLNGVIYSAPIMVGERITIYANDLSNYQMRIVRIDKYLNLLENRTFEFEKSKDLNNQLIVDKTLVGLENVVVFNNKYLLGYYVEDSFIYLSEYMINMNVMYEYRILIDKEYQDFEIINCFKEDNTIVFTYSIDGKYGYYYLDIINEKYGSLSIFDDQKYYVTLNNIISESGNNYEISPK